MRTAGPPARVLQVLAELRPSGLEVMLRSSAHLWKHHGYELDILATTPSVGSFADELSAAGYGIHHIPLTPFARFVPAYIRLLRRRRYDVVHVHPERANFYVALLARLARTPRVLVGVHSLFPFEGALRFERRVQRSVLRRAGITSVSVSEPVRDSELERFGHPTICVENWCDDTRFVPPTAQQRDAARAAFDLAGDSVAIAVVGNCNVLKRHELAIQALEHTGDRLLLLHAGHEESGATERELASRLGIANRIRFLGPLADVLPLLHAADCFLMTSRHEGLSIAALEAASAGVPLVFTDSPGLRELAQQLQGTLLVQATPPSIAEGLQQVAALTPAQRTDLGRSIAESARARFGMARGVAAYAELYDGGTVRTPWRSRRERRP